MWFTNAGEYEDMRERQTRERQTDWRGERKREKSGKRGMVRHSKGGKGEGEIDDRAVGTRSDCPHPPTPPPPPPSPFLSRGHPRVLTPTDEKEVHIYTMQTSTGAKQKS